MKNDRIFKKSQRHSYMVGGIFALVMLVILLIPSPQESWADVILVQHDFPKPAPAPSVPPLGAREFDIGKTPSLTHKTPGLSDEKKDEFGLFMDKNRHGLGLQWQPGGNIPGVDLGFESHNLNSLNRILPSTEPYPEWTPQSDSQYFGNSRTAPDHSGAFLRFRW